MFIRSVGQMATTMAMVLFTAAGAAALEKGSSRITVVEKKQTSEAAIEKLSAEAEYGYAPRVTLSAPSTMFGNYENRVKLTWRETDDRVISVFLTVFFHDGDVQTVNLYDTRLGDPPSSSGTINLTINPAAYDPDLGSNGTVIVTVTDEALNFTQMSSSFVVR